MWRFILESFIWRTYITYRSKRVRPRRFIPPCWTWAELSSAFFLRDRFLPKVLMRRVWHCMVWRGRTRAALHRLCLWPVTKLRAVHFPYFPRWISALTCREIFNGGFHV